VAIILACHGQAFSNVVENNEVVATSDSDADGYIYTPLVRDGVMWKYVHSGMNYDYTEPYVFETYCYISGTVEVDGKLYHKCFVENPNLDDVCVAYLREEDKRVYMMSVWEEKDREIYFYQTGGKEELIYDFNLNVGDTYISNNTNLEVKSVKRECVDGTLRKTYEVYGEKHFDSGYMESHTYTIVEGVGVTGSCDGLFCFPYVEAFVGEPYPEFEEVVLNYSTGVEELFDTDAAGSLTLAQGAGVVTICGAVGEVTAAIYALDGVVRVQASAEGSVNLSVAELPVGIYVIKAVDGAGRRLAKKIVVR
jgi:hypothetical protein